MIQEPPDFLDGARVYLWTPLDERHARTGRVRLFADRAEQLEFAALAIAGYEENGQTKLPLYFFYCNHDWGVTNDTDHDSVWYPRLLHATPKQRADWKIAGDGYGIHWPDIDEDLSIEGLLAG